MSQMPKRIMDPNNYAWGLGFNQSEKPPGGPSRVALLPIKHCLRNMNFLLSFNCYDCMLISAPNVYVDTPILRVMVFEDEASGR